MQNCDGRIDGGEAIHRWMVRVRAEFGLASGAAIIKSLIEECGGLRMRLPDIQDIYCEERNRIIRNKFTGANYEELALSFNLTVRHIRRILSEK